MHSIKTKFTLLTVLVVVITLSIATVIGVVSIKKLGQTDADRMLHLTATTGAMDLESYFESVEHSVETVATLVQDSFEGMPYQDLEEQVENTRNIFSRIAYNTNGVLTYYFRIDPEISKTVKGFWYVNQDGHGFKEHQVTDITQYDTNDTSNLLWFTVPKATGKGVWLPPYNTENLDAIVISYNVPVYWKGEFVGVIGIEIDYETLKKEVENIKIFENGYAFILDEENNVIYHPQTDSEKLELEMVAIEDPDDAIGHNHVRYTYEGVEKDAVWTPLRNGMELFVTAPVSEIDRGWKGMVQNMLVAALIILALSVLVMMRFSGRLARPLTDLTEAAKEVQKGNYDFELDYDKDDEVGVLTETFRQLTDYTKEHINAARKMATVDALTGVKNKHAYAQWEEKIDAQIREGSQEPFAVVVCDINDMKAVNDQFGHKEGDVCIKRACGKICHVFKHSPVFRIGGDEFLVLLSGKDYYQRKKLVEQINAVPKAPAKVQIGETISAGMAEYKKEQHRSLLSVFEEADKKMYERKQALKESLPPEEKAGNNEPGSEYIPVIHARKTILIVDDVEMNREIMGDLLHEDYDVLYASDGDEALDIRRSHVSDIDLLLLDLQMPNKNGQEVIAEMQVDEDLMSIPVVVLTIDQEAELDCLRSGAMDFIPKPYPNIEIVKARVAKCIELSEDRDLIRYTERDKLTGLLNRDYFYRYVNRLDHLYRDDVLDAIVCDVNRFHSANKQYGRKFGDHLLHIIGEDMRKLAREIGGIVCREGDDIFLLYCPHQDDYEKMFRTFTANLSTDQQIEGKVGLWFGVFVDARQEPDVEDRFSCAKIAADRVKEDPDALYGFYERN